MGEVSGRVHVYVHVYVRARPPQTRLVSVQKANSGQKTGEVTGHHSVGVWYYASTSTLLVQAVSRRPLNGSLK